MFLHEKLVLIPLFEKSFLCAERCLMQMVKVAFSDPEETGWLVLETAKNIS